MEIPNAEWVWVSGDTVHALALIDDDSGSEPVQAVRYQIPFKIEQASPLMCDVAEAIASRRLTPEGSMEIWPASKETFRDLAKAALDSNVDSPFIQWVRWLLLERDSELGQGLK